MVFEQLALSDIQNFACYLLVNLASVCYSENDKTRSVLSFDQRLFHYQRKIEHLMKRNQYGLGYEP